MKSQVSSKDFSCNYTQYSFQDLMFSTFPVIFACIWSEEILSLKLLWFSGFCHLSPVHPLTLSLLSPRFPCSHYFLESDWWGCLPVLSLEIRASMQTCPAGFLSHCEEEDKPRQNFHELEMWWRRWQQCKEIWVWTENRFNREISLGLIELLCSQWVTFPRFSRE